MTGPEQPPAPSVSTAPAEGASSGTASPRAPLARRRLPAHIGPARTSTVLLAIAFVAIGVLYMFVKPPAEARTPGAGTESPAITAPPVVPTTAAPAEPAAPTTEQPTQEPETTAPTSEAEPTPTGEPADPTAETTEPSVPEDTTAPAPGTSAPLPTTAAPSS